MKEETIKDLKALKNELEEKIKAIDLIINVFSRKDNQTEVALSANEDDVKGDENGKGSMTWTEYIKYLIKLNGGKGTSPEIIDLANKYNEDVKRSSIRMHLSTMLKKGILKSEPVGENRNLGYVYSIK
ncbi:MAG: hypothetical protein JXR58_00110 [Bacteroidales bacterium]|nr:hypothetical protein [Bacteroidales bacterium]